MLIQEAYYLAKVLSSYLRPNCQFPVTLFAGLPEENSTCKTSAEVVAKPDLCRLILFAPNPFPYLVFCRQGSQGTSLSHWIYFYPFNNKSQRSTWNIYSPSSLFKIERTNHLIFIFWPALISSPDQETGAMNYYEGSTSRGKYFWLYTSHPALFVYCCVSLGNSLRGKSSPGKGLGDHLHEQLLRSLPDRVVVSSPGIITINKLKQFQYIECLIPPGQILVL